MGLIGSELAQDRAVIERSNTRKGAILAKGRMMGHKFIRLILKNIRKRKISGVDVLHAQEFRNEAMGGITDYELSVQGGDIDFEYRGELGAYIFDMVDTERNRQFLATHYEYGFWDITDDLVNYDVKARYEKIKHDLLSKPKTKAKDLPREFWNAANEESDRVRRMARGEEENEVEEQLQPISDVVEKGKIPEPKKVHKVQSLAKKKGWPKGQKRGPSPWRKLTNDDRVLEASGQKYINPKPEDTPTTSDTKEDEKQPILPNYVGGTESSDVGVGVVQP